MTYIPSVTKQYAMGHHVVLGDDATTFASLHAQALASFAGSGAQAAVVTINPSGTVAILPQTTSDAASTLYDQTVEQANQGQYIYVALFDHAKSATPDGLMDETFTGVGIAQTIQAYSPWIIIGGVLLLAGLVMLDKSKKKKARRRSSPTYRRRTTTTWF